ncbi:histidinol-phosphate transaminase [Lacisediminihabitans changchengi]|uniref:Histidinol-phosphate transaminase n=1 Tax=Lacisediminihabitans changchengi TaxID=2787634 RepID=A0A934SVD0_9MICO|nr:histidinol-phosphate transaminase [Lacisediminihabitans changchengi]MBK4348719.1 histidinol-phosphate transaminase [Lacisediminihabitans changchengi]
MTADRQPPVRLRPEIVALAAYAQGKPAAHDAFKLSSNENPFEPIEAVREAIAGSSINRYPDASGRVVRARIAERFGVSEQEVHLGAGSVSILAQLIQAAAAPGDEVVYAWRSFEAYPGLVAVCGATSVTVPIRADGRHDLDAMAAAITDRTRVVIVCSPNNPTGSIVTAQEFERFMQLVPNDVLVLLDEAYIEFVTDPTVVNGRTLTGRYPNLVVLRTFSKAYGLAGLRIGYAVGPEYILNAARSTAIPLSVTEQAQLAAMASLDNEDVLLERVRDLAVLRDEIWSALREQGWDSPKPHGNFIWLETKQFTERAAGIFSEHGIVARALGTDGIRISIGEKESVASLLRASEEVVRSLPSTL